MVERYFGEYYWVLGGGVCFVVGVVFFVGGGFVGGYSGLGGFGGVGVEYCVVSDSLVDGYFRLCLIVD